MSLLIVNYSKLLSSGACSDDIIEWFNLYIKKKLKDPQFIAFKYGGEESSMMIMGSQFEKVGVVDALAQLSWELLEHKVAMAYPTIPAKEPTSDVIYDLHDSLPDIPTHMQLIPPAKTPAKVSAKVALAALEDATGVKWMERNFGSLSCYSTVSSFYDHEELSKALRMALNHPTRDIPHLHIAENKVIIPTGSIDGGNLGLLIESGAELKPQFASKRIGGGEDYPPLRL